MNRGQSVFPNDERHGTTSSTKVVVTAPPGRLGIHLVDNVIGSEGTIISKVNTDSPLAGRLLRGDHVINVNGIDVCQMRTPGKTFMFVLYFPFRTSRFTQYIS